MSLVFTGGGFIIIPQHRDFVAQGELVFLKIAVNFLLDGITDVLVAFAGISLVTSMIMIGILTYTSVLERTKEIGVLKALGARKRDITQIGRAHV